MLRVAVAASAAAAVSAIEVDSSLYTQTPAGRMLSSCVHTVPSGSTIERTANGATVTHLDGSTSTLPKCETNGLPLILKDESVVSTRSALRSSTTSARDRRAQLPADYDGWLEYAAYNDPTASGFKSFLGSFSVPAEPTSDPDMLYLFTALENIDWIPKVRFATATRRRARQRTRRRFQHQLTDLPIPSHARSPRFRCRSTQSPLQPSTSSSQCCSTQATTATTGP